MSGVVTLSHANETAEIDAWKPDVSDAQMLDWWRETHRGLESSELCNKPGEFSVHPVRIHERLYNRAAADLPRIVALARAFCRRSGSRTIWTREDQRALVRAYADAKELPGVARPDGIFVGDQLKLLELNVDSGIGGYFEVDHVQDRFRQLLELSPGQGLRAPGTLDSVWTLFRELRMQSDVATFNVAIIAYPHFRPYHVRQTQLLARRLQEEVPSCTCRVVFADELNSAGEWMTDGLRDVHMLWRFGAGVHPPDVMQPVMRALLAARATRTVVMSDPNDLAVEGKLVLAALSHAVETDDGLLEDEERALVEAYVPWTRCVTGNPVTFHGDRMSIRTLFSEHRASLVLKRAHSKSTQQVYLGAEQPPETWDSLAAQALEESGCWVVQENLKSAMLPFSYFDADGRRHSHHQAFTYNQFVFGKHCAAPLIRIERDSTKRKVAMAVSSAMAITGTVVDGRARAGVTR